MHSTAASSEVPASLESDEIRPLAYTDYGKELTVKNAALSEFWHRNRLQGAPVPIIPSPKPRRYRTTSKRRVFSAHNRYRLRFSHRKELTPNSAMLSTLLEPKEHEIIYQFLLEKLNTPAFSVTAKQLTYIIIRGSYTEFIVIFNIANVNGAIVKNLKNLAQHLLKLNVNVVSTFVFCDPARSDYYLDNRPAEGAWKVKNLFGPDFLRLTFGEYTFHYNPVSFSQINESIIPLLLEQAALLCRAQPAERFIDLYCGYGLFSNYMSKQYGEVWGIDYDELSVEHARTTARYRSKKINISARTHFRTTHITPGTLEALLPKAGTVSETILLDPSRQGPVKGVIQFCADRHPSRVLHIFCNVDRIPEDVEQWHRNGYRIKDIVPLDMFPGTPNLEVLILLVPSR